jgi:hypothetical protein
MQMLVFQSLLTDNGTYVIKGIIAHISLLSHCSWIRGLYDSLQGGTTPMSISLRASVGEGGRNERADVLLVQTLLAQVVQFAAADNIDPGAVNGECHNQTKIAIRVFQSRFLDHPDGRIDPHGQSLRNLNRLTAGPFVCLRPPGTINAAKLVQKLLPHQGEKYVLGAIVPKEHPDWIGPWDCAEFVAWGIYQVSGRLVGCRPAQAPNGMPYYNAYTGWFGQDLPSCAVEVTEDEAAEVPGCLALRIGRGEGQIGHIAVSRGGNQTIEAAGRRERVRCKRLKGRTWTSFWRLTFLQYSSNQCSFV